MAHFSCFAGARALSEFRQTRLLQVLQAIDPNLLEVHGRYVHFVNSNGALTQEDADRVAALLHYGDPASTPGGRGN